MDATMPELLIDFITSLDGYAAAEGWPGTDALAGMSKVVFSTTLTEPLSWANTQLLARDPVEAVREMKDNGSEPMRSIGSLTLCRSLLKAGLVDRFRWLSFPSLPGPATGNGSTTAIPMLLST
jgi:dihydrofolate reductase